MLKKPRRGWWVCPGGKVDADELWPDAVIREVQEETGLIALRVRLAGIYSMTVASEHATRPTKRLLGQFYAEHVEGQLLSASKEGVLAIQSATDLKTLPMDEGDRRMILNTMELQLHLSDTPLFFGHFHYDTQHRLLDMEISPMR